MAQETRIAPIELNNDASKILMNLGENISKQNMQRDQLDFENRKLEAARFKEQQKNIEDLEKDAATQITSLKASPEQIDTALKQIHENSAKALKGGMGYLELKSSINKTVGLMNMYANTRNGLEEQAKTVASNNTDIDPSKLRQEMSTLTMADPSTIDVTANDYASEIVNSKYGWKVFDPTKAQATAVKVISADKGKQVESVKVGTQIGNVRTNEGTKIQYDPKFYIKDKDGLPKLRTDEHGIVDQEVYDNLTTNASINAHLEHRVDKIKSDYAALDDKQKEAFWLNAGYSSKDLTGGIPKKFGETEHDIIKKSLATTLIKENSPVSVITSEGKTIVTNNTYNPNAYVSPTDPDFTAPLDRLRAITKLDSRFLGKESLSVSGKKVYDVTDQFKNTLLFKNQSSGKPYGPAEVQYNAGDENTPPQILIRNKKGKPLKAYSVQQFTDLLEPNTGGTGYDPKAKPSRGNPRIQ